ncbi:UbiA-like protein EboC [Flavimarina sp. Hel_I_48]|uniref:UbiA-like protein EboC n=1 Tax=Flavimarina sp. Hel_I_48 TaxID=1392488 RepID=UPI0004DFBBAD|nr:UbiA-like protein EboC [Flavimarina sp. Hel_I_48]
MNPALQGYLRLARPANLPTAAADILTGAAVAGLFTSLPHNETIWYDFVALVFSSVFLYAGGVVFNDFFDYRIDQLERPERPLPSGVVSLKAAAIFGGVLMLLGILLAFYANFIAGAIALVLALAILTYDAFSKKSAFFGPLNMGLCRSLNLLLGMALLVKFGYWPIVFTPLIYIGAITMISQGEVHGNNKRSVAFAGVLYLFVLLGILAATFFWELQTLQALPFLLVFAFLIFKPLYEAYRENSPKNIKKAVKAGVIALIVMDACIAVAFSEWWVGLLVLLLLPLSIGMSKLFAVT